MPDLGDGAPDDLALWTPVALSFEPPGPTLDWGDLRGVRFAEPFFDQTVARWAGGEPAPLVRTGLDALLALDASPSLDPALVIFHLSRCGSTLLSRLLATLPGTLVIAEPAPLNALLEIPPERVDHRVHVEVLRLLVRALGRRRFGDEHRYVLKLSSWNIRRAALFRDAFPGVPAIWLQREPCQVIASLLARPAGWMRLRHLPERAASLLGLAPLEVEPETAPFLAQALAQMLAAAAGPGGPEHVIDYAELPTAAWRDAAPLLGFTPGADEIARMREEARYDAKRGSEALGGARTPFAGDPPGRQALVDSVRALAARRAAPLYRSLALPARLG